MYEDVDSYFMEIRLSTRGSTKLYKDDQLTNHIWTYQETKNLSQESICMGT